MSFFRVEKEENNTYSVYFSEKFYELFQPYYCGGSYWNVLYRVWGLMPRDFYHYCGFTYNAYFKPSDCIRNVKMFFTKKSDAIAFCDEGDRRINVSKEEKENG